MQFYLQQQAPLTKYLARFGGASWNAWCNAAVIVVADLFGDVLITSCDDESVWIVSDGLISSSSSEPDKFCRDKVTSRRGYESVDVLYRGEHIISWDEQHDVFSVRKRLTLSLRID